MKGESPFWGLCFASVVVLKAGGWYYRQGEYPAHGFNRNYERSKRMGDYIKREDAIARLKTLWEEIHEEDCLIDPDCKIGIDRAIDIVNFIPSADVESVRHGRWENDDGSKAECSYDAYCSVCGELSEYLTDYCPNCGARMEGREE